MKAPVELIRVVIDEETGSLGWEQTRWYPTSADDSGRRAVQDALTGEPAVVLVAGGDGTVRAAAQVAHGTGTPIALLPFGTGNLLARNLGLTLNNIASAVRAALTGATRLIDVALADLLREDGTRTQHAFLVMAGIGLDADMANNTSVLAKKYVGWLAYIAPIVRSVVANRQFHLHYRIDGGRARSAHAHTVIVGNCGTLTGNMLLLPAAVVDDGQLDVVMLRPKSRYGWARIGTRLTVQGVANRSAIGKLWFRRIPDLHSLAYAQGRHFQARFETPRAIQLDGDSFGEVVAANIRVQPAALAMRVPMDVPASVSPGGR